MTTEYRKKIIDVKAEVQVEVLGDVTLLWMENKIKNNKNKVIQVFDIRGLSVLSGREYGLASLLSYKKVEILADFETMSLLNMLHRGDIKRKLSLGREKYLEVFKKKILEKDFFLFEEKYAVTQYHVIVGKPLYIKNNMLYYKRILTRCTQPTALIDCLKRKEQYYTLSSIDLFNVGTTVLEDFVILRDPCTKQEEFILNYLKEIITEYQ